MIKWNTFLFNSLFIPQNISESDSVSDDTERVESDPQNTYLQVGATTSLDQWTALSSLQVGEWIAQWDAPYEAWYYYNANSGKSREGEECLQLSWVLSTVICPTKTQYSALFLNWLLQECRHGPNLQSWRELSSLIPSRTSSRPNTKWR